MDTKTQRQLFLLGFPPMEEALGFLTTKTQPKMETRQAAELWRRANDRIRQTMQAEIGLCDRINVEELPAELRERAAALEASEVFQKSFAVVPARVMMVELAPLVIFQKAINLSHVERLETKLTREMTPSQLFDACLASCEQPRVATAWPGPAAIQLSSLSNDLRFLEAIQLSPELIDKLPLGGTAVSVIALAMGFGPNLINAVRVNNRLVLNNGSHRAYTLLKLGYRQVPCVVQEVTRQEEVPLVLPQLQNNPQQMLAHPRPPMLQDLLKEELTTVISMPVEKRVVTVQWMSQPIDSPA